MPLTSWSPTCSPDRSILARQLLGEPVLLREAVQSAGRHDRDAVGLGHPRQLRCHADGLANHGEPGLLTGGAVEHELPGLGAGRVEELLAALPHLRPDDRAAVVTDVVHRDQAGAAGADEMLACTRA